jgi:c-di-GMP-binding flagellar brake protein YcgR
MAKDSDRCAMGLKFKEISKENQDEVLKYIIKAQIAK